MEKTFETPGAVRLYVENEVGLVAISARETHATVVSLEPDTPGAEEIIERATVECRPAGSRRLVAVKVPHRHGMRFVRRNAVIVRVEVPHGCDVTVVTGSADVEITGSVDAAEIKSASGSITTDDVAANVTAKTASGDVTLGAVGAVLGCTPHRGTCVAPAWPAPPSSRRHRAIWSWERRPAGWRSRRPRATSAWASCRTAPGS